MAQIDQSDEITDKSDAQGQDAPTKATAPQMKLLLVAAPLAVLLGIGAIATLGSNSDRTRAAAGDEQARIANAIDTAATPTTTNDEAANVRVPAQPSFSDGTCQSAIAGRLTQMEIAAADGTLAWSDHRAAMTTLAQQVLDCPAAGLDVTGSLELLDRGMADLDVHWDGHSNRLHLRTISVDTPPDATAPVDAETIRFVLR